MLEKREREEGYL